MLEIQSKHTKVWISDMFGFQTFRMSETFTLHIPKIGETLMQWNAEIRTMSKSERFVRFVDVRAVRFIFLLAEVILYTVNV